MSSRAAAGTMRPSVHLRVSILSLALALVAPAQESPGAPGAPDAPEVPEAPDAMAAYLTGCEAFGFSGAVLVARDGEVLLRSGHGVQGDEALSAEHTFEVGELAQWFTAVAVLRLADREAWRLLDPLADHVEGVLNVHRRITLRQLLTHTTGMSRFGPSVDETELGPAVRRHLSVRPTFDAGTRVQPWDGGYALLAAAVESVAEEPFEAFVEREVFELAGMSSASFRGRSPSVEAPRARAHGTGELAGAGTLHWGLRGARGVVLGVDDLFRFDRALAAGDLLSADARARSERAVRSGFACGVWSRPTLGGRAAVWRGGREPGFEAEFWRFPDEGACIAVLANRNDGAAGAVARNLAALLFGEEPPLPLPPPVVESTEELASVAGDYELETGGVLRFEWTGERARVRGLDAAAHDLLFTGSLLTSLDRFDGEKEQALAILDELAREASTSAREAGPRAVEEGLWDRARALRRNAVEDAAEVGERDVYAATSVGSGRVRVLVRHREGDGDRFSAVTFAGGLWVDFEADADPGEVVRTYRPTGARTLRSFDWFRERAPSFTVEPGEEPPSLVVETPSGRSARARPVSNIPGDAAYAPAPASDPDPGRRTGPR